MTRATRTHRSEADWKTFMQQQASSGQSVRAFCKRDIGWGEMGPRNGAGFIFLVQVLYPEPSILE